MRGFYYSSTAAIVLALAGATQAQGVDVKLTAASVPLSEDSVEIRLRWPVVKGWLPEGGFRLYRGEGKDQQQIFPKPPPTIKLDKTKLFRPNALALKNLSLKGGTDLGVALTRAATKTRSTQPVALFAPRTPRAPSSAALFGVRAGTLKKRALESPFALRSRSTDEEPAELVAYWSRVGNEAVRTRALTPRAPDPDDSVLESRTDLMISAMTDQKVAASLGIAATDTAKPGEKLNYRLMAVLDEGKEVLVATLDFVAGENPPPPMLEGLRAEQVGDGLVALRWERPSEELLQRLGTVGYRMVREDARTPKGKPLTETPFFITEIPAQGGAVEPIAFFTDDDAAIGTARYRVIALDMFGRESPAAEIKLDVEDMRPASPPRLAQAALETNKVRVVWQKSASEGAQYHIWRRDAEVENSAFVRLTPQPVAGQAGDAPAVVRALAGRGLGDQLIKPGSGLNLGGAGGKFLLDPKITSVGDPILNIPPVVQNLPPPPGGGVIRPGEFQTPPTQIGKLPLELNLLSSYLDATAQPDKKYVYAVTAQLPGSKAESAPAETRVVAYPAPAPAAPVVATPVFKKGTPLKISFQSFQLIKSTSSTATINASNALKNLRAVSPTQNRAELRWTAPAGQTRLRYHIYRSDAPNPGPDDWEFRGETDTLMFTDALPPARAISYTYRVNALNRWEAMSSPGKATLNAPPTIPPGAPEVVGVRPDAQGRMALRLRSAPADEGVVRYRVTRKSIRPLVLQLTEPVFVKAFRARSADLTSRGEGVVDDEGEPLVVTERPIATGELKARGTGQAVLAKDLPESAAGYSEVVVSTVPADASGLLTLIDAGVKQGETYFYRVVAETADGLRSAESEPLGAQATPPRELPGVAGFLAQAATEGVQLKWNPSPAASGYVLTRISTGRPRMYRVTGTAWTDKTAQPGVAYRYQIRAVGAGGGLSPATEVAFTLLAR